MGVLAEVVLAAEHLAGVALADDLVQGVGEVLQLLAGARLQGWEMFG
jgi:hypothetical protein